MEDMFLIVGLGNPGREYARTRHNAGFMLVERLADKWRAANWSEDRRFNARMVRASRGDQKLVLCEPQTYMNLSGEAVRKVADFYKVSPRQIMVAVDDADLVFGQIRLRKSGSSGGHHGLENIERHLGTQDFPRLRLGIGRTDSNVREISNYVLGQFSASENALLEKILEKASSQIECWLDEGIDKAMSKFNGAVEPVNKEK